MTRVVPVFDGHNDVLLRLIMANPAKTEQDFIRGDAEGHLDLPRMLEGSLLGGLFACYVPSPRGGGEMSTPSLEDAQRTTIRMASLLSRIAEHSQGRFRLCRTAADIRAAMAAGAIAAVFHIEGAEAIDADLRALDLFHAAGLRTLGPVWSRPNIFGHGVPFRFPSTPDIGPGLTDLGKQLVRRCGEMKIMVDLSHLNDAGFWDVVAISDAPLVASHSNVHRLSAQSRNLTDRQLDAIRERDGFVGVNFGAMFIRSDGAKIARTPLEDLVRHIDYLVERIGEDRVGFGSDYDGTTVPDDIGSGAKVQNLIIAMRDKGYGEALIDKIAHGNWIRVLAKTWGEPV